MWRYLLRPLLFRLDAEWVHYLAMGSFSCGLKLPLAHSFLSQLSAVNDKRLQVNVLGLNFGGPIGLAAGFDKDARWFRQLATLGFSHIEVGTLTGQPQPGNPKKRLFRFPKDQALLNCMGFNNRGSDAARKSLEKTSVNQDEFRCLLGINIGLSKTVAVKIANESTPGNANPQVSPHQSARQGLQWAIDDYLLSFQRMHPFADYFTINVSSPNTQGLRDLQHPSKIGELIREIRKANLELSRDQTPKPILVKLAPDLTEKELDETLEALVNEKVDGLIATNTTVSSENLTTNEQVIRSKRCQCPSPGGGFSGLPLTEISRRFVASIYRKTNGDLPIIGVGGIMNGEDAWRMIGAGASIVQVYTGFIYGGPFFVKQINRYLVKKMDQEGLSSIEEFTGQQV